MKAVANGFLLGKNNYFSDNWNRLDGTLVLISLVEKICEYEAVHPIVSWTDIKTRVGEHRRCFVYTHPSMPGEPVVILHVALTPGHVADNVDTLVRHREQRSPEVREECRAAIFYSVTSTQAGLQGIELGTHLIKQAVTRLQASAVKRYIGSTTGCTITEKAPTRAFSWLKAPTSAFTFKTR